MMLCKFSINMYSGCQPPECKLLPEQIEKINELVSRLDAPYIGQNPFHGLGCLSSTSYCVYWLDEQWIGNINSAIYPPFEGPWMHLMVDAGKPVHLYRKEEDFQGTYLQDTVGLWEYLSTIGAPLLANHFAAINSAYESFNEKVLGIPK